MSNRIALHEKLSEIQGVTVYYQPPENISISYPCIIYNLESGDHKYADNILYHYTDKYSIKVITDDSDNNYVSRLQSIGARFDNLVYYDGLYQYYFSIYY